MAVSVTTTNKTYRYPRRRDRISTNLTYIKVILKSYDLPKLLCKPKGQVPTKDKNNAANEILCKLTL